MRNGQNIGLNKTEESHGSLPCVEAEVCGAPYRSLPAVSAYGSQLTMASPYAALRSGPGLQPKPVRARLTRQAGDQDGFALKANVSSLTVELGYSEYEELRSNLLAGGRPQLAETSIRR